MNPVFLTPLAVALLFVAASLADARFGAREKVDHRRLARQTALVFGSSLAVTAAWTLAGDVVTDFFSAITDRPAPPGPARAPEVLPGKPTF